MLAGKHFSVLDKTYDIGDEVDMSVFDDDHIIQMIHDGVLIIDGDLIGDQDGESDGLEQSTESI